MIRVCSLALLTSLALRVACAQEVTPAQVAETRADQARPRKPVLLDAESFDKLVGAYHLYPDTVVWVTRDGSHCLFRFTGLPAREYFPESQTKFFSSEMSSQFSFDSDADGHVTGLVLHQSGMEQGAPRITVEDAKAVEDGLTARIKGNTPSPGSEAALRHQLAAVETGEFDYAAFSPELAALVRSQALAASQRFAALGALKSLTFKSVSQRGFDVYDAVFEHGELNCWIWPLADGKIKGFRYLAASQAP